MCRPQQEPLRPLKEQERTELERLRRSQREPAVHVAHAQALLAVSVGASFTAAAHAAGRRSGDGVAKLVTRFNTLGLAAVAGRPLPGRVPTCDEQACERILAEARRVPEPVEDDAANLLRWRRWQRGLRWPWGLGEKLPALRRLLVLANLVGHLSASLGCWMFDHGIMPLYTPVGGSWLNMAESVQRLLKRRALECQHPRSPAEIIERLESTAEGGNREPTPFERGGRRAERRRRERLRRQRLGGSGARAIRPPRWRAPLSKQWQQPCHLTH